MLRITELKESSIYRKLNLFLTISHSDKCNRLVGEADVMFSSQTLTTPKTSWLHSN